jgi:hypothetical protein
MRAHPTRSINEVSPERPERDTTAFDMERSSDQEKEVGMTEKDANTVDFDGPDDPENPMNWSSSRKITAIIIATAMTLLSYVHKQQHRPHLFSPANRLPLQTSRLNNRLLRNPRHPPAFLLHEPHTRLLCNHRLPPWLRLRSNPHRTPLRNVRSSNHVQDLLVPVYHLQRRMRPIS